MRGDSCRGSRSTGREGALMRGTRYQYLCAMKKVGVGMLLAV